MDLLQAVYARDHERVASIRASRPLTLPEAAAVGDVEQVGALLASGTDVGERSPDGFPALTLACHFDQAGVAALLVRAGADVTARATGAMTVQPLHAAAASATGACVPLLIAAGAPVDGTQSGGFTPLHEAATRKLRRLVELLLAAGADPTLVADDGRDAAGMADEAGDPDLAALLRSVSASGA